MPLRISSTLWSISRC